MSCEKCENEPIVGAFYRWKTANVEIVACKAHWLEISEALHEAQSKPKRPVTAERIEIVLEDKFQMVESVWLDIGGKEAEIRFDELAKAILAEMNEGEK